MTKTITQVMIHRMSVRPSLFWTKVCYVLLNHYWNYWIVLYIGITWTSIQLQLIFFFLRDSFFLNLLSNSSQTPFGEQTSRRIQECQTYQRNFRHSEEREKCVDNTLRDQRQRESQSTRIYNWNRLQSVAAVHVISGHSLSGHSKRRALGNQKWVSIYLFIEFR